MVDSSNCNKDFLVKSRVEIRVKQNSNICPLSDNYYSKCPVMRSYYYLVEEFFASWSWSG
ncbi:hypothetical protein MNBD_GAMMA22-2126 [hydrothermal vent metagenome]|uniref:Uncharacterized protein n=1 Tax=hydrothermal vent metagenome TaxID=652676 RepID=A0A3B1A763_9ZZZZ